MLLASDLLMSVDRAGREVRVSTREVREAASPQRGEYSGAGAGAGRLQLAGAGAACCVVMVRRRVEVRGQ